MSRLEEIQLRSGAASPGPWEANRTEDGGTRVWVSEKSDYRGSGPALVVCDEHMSRSNADFIAHAPEDIAYLVAEVERRDAFTEAVRDSVFAWGADILDATKAMREIAATLTEMEEA